MVDRNKKENITKRIFQYINTFLAPLFSKLILTFGLGLLLLPSIFAIEIERFELLNSRDGLSQNNVLCMYADHQGFMWFGTMDGLNRYDGYNFKVIKAGYGNQNGLTNNRISQIWEDKNNMLWVKTYDGYFHYLERNSERFSTFPTYRKNIEEKNSTITCFFEDRNRNIWLGTTNTGIYFLEHIKEKLQYKSTQLLAKDGKLAGNHINFIIEDTRGLLWIGTDNGLNSIDKKRFSDPKGQSKVLKSKRNVTHAVLSNNWLYFSVENEGLFKLNTETEAIEPITQLSGMAQIPQVNLMQLHTPTNTLLIGTSNLGLISFNTASLNTFILNEFGREIRQLHTDRQGLVWIKTNRYGVVCLNVASQETTKFDLVEPEKQAIIDDERPFFFEDRADNLWIGTHGGGLLLFDRTINRFKFYKNTPTNTSTLSSDFVHAIAEDRSGQLWVGTGQFNGGANKAFLSNPSFRLVTPRKQLTSMADNVVRTIFQDSNRHIWVATKSGKIYIYNSKLELKRILDNLHASKTDLPGYNIYAITEDKDGYIWLGSKGKGVLVSASSTQRGESFYNQLSFNSYLHNANNSNSLSDNSVYALHQDSYGQMWIGTYGGGLNKVLSRTANELVCMRINTENSNLSSNDIRHIIEDSNHNLWIGTAFGLNTFKLTRENSFPKFTSFFYNPDDLNSISYNDIIHIFEDSKKQLWFGTFGGGVNLLKKFEGAQSKFTHLKTSEGLSNDAVFSILEDKSGKIWMGTEQGISSYLPARLTFENYDTNSGLYSDNFSENTCFRTADGQLLFGCTAGILVIDAERIEKTHYAPPIVLTNFQLNNRTVNINDPNSPIKSDIGTLENITLKYNQSSFSFEYAALSFFAPDQNSYAFKLENFENDWNYVGNQRKATYTNLSPGDYVFLVKAANWDGSWNEIPRKIQIKILPPWWKSTPALIAYIVFFLFAIELLRRIFLKYYRLQNDLQVERRVNTIKLQFFTNISHEIRTPLTLILGPIDDIKRTPNLPPSVQNSIGIMERNGKRMLKLVNELLDFRKLQNKKATLKIASLNMGEFVSEIVEQFKPIAQQKRLAFNYKKPETEVTVWADPNKADSVIFNVLSNAFKYTSRPEGIEVSFDCSNPKYVDILVTDHGPGIEKSKIDFLFQRYTPLSNDDNQLKGTGIGLSLSYEIMQLHQGDILVDSERGVGSTFRIRFKTGTDHFDKETLISRDKEQGYVHQEYIPEASDALQNQDSTLKPSTEKPMVLIVEDNPEVLLYVAESVSNHFRIETALNGKHGLELAAKLHPDLIITDVMMPEMDGVEMTKQLKQNFETSHIPVVMLTAKSNMADQIDGIESGAEAYILKPFNSEYLRAVSQNFIRQREVIFNRFGNKQTNVPKPESTTKLTSKDELFLTELFKLIEDNLQTSEFNVDKLISLTPYSRTVMYNKVKGLLGVSPVDLIRQMRLKHAARLLSEAGYNISEAAYASGFNDIRYFRQCFKNQYNETPSEYRNRQTGKTTDDTEDED